LSEIDIIAIYCLPSPRLLLPAPSLVSCRASSPTPTSKHPDKRLDWTAADGWRREINGAAQLMDGGGGGGDGRWRTSRWETATAAGDGNGGSGALEGETAARSRCAA
jgi:hypothetical protein